MDDLEHRTGWLLQLPSRALRTLIAARVTAEHRNQWLQGQGIRYRKWETAIQRLTVEQLIQLINAYPADVTDAVIEAEFKEYRHGRSPTLRFYTFPSGDLADLDLKRVNRRAQNAVRRANQTLQKAVGKEEALPRLQELAMEPFVRTGAKEWPAALHAGYHCQYRLDYVAPDERAISTYQLLYGHVWVDPGRAFIALHAHPAALEPTLVEVLSQALGARLTLVRVDKELKRELKFLQKASCRRVRLVDPNPERKRFRSLTLGDDEDLARREYLGRDYQAWENDFPEIASMRYRAQFLPGRDTSLSIGATSGSLTLSGAVAAGEMRDWARDTGGQIVEVWRDRQRRWLERPLALDHERLWTHPLLAGFPDDLRSPVLALVRALATIKARQDPQFNTWPLPLEMGELALTSARAQAMEQLGEAINAGGPVPWFRVMVRVVCPVEDCTAATDYLVCPACGRNLFWLALSDQGERVLMCTHRYCEGKWAGGFPIQTICEDEHDIELAWDSHIGERLELFVNPEFAFLIQKLLEGEAQHYNARGESLWVRDDVLVHQDKRPDYVVREAGEVTIHTGGGAVIMGSAHVQGDFIGRDQIVTRRKKAA